MAARVLLAIFLASPFASVAAAQNPTSPRVSLDQSVVWSGVTLADEQVAHRHPATGAVTPVVVALLPATVDLTGYHEASDGSVWVALDTATFLGGLLVEPRDVARIAGGSATLLLDGSAAGIPDGVRVDAVTAAAGDLVVSFDQAVRFSAALTAEDEDLVAFTAGGPALFFDGSAAGLDPGLDLDAAHVDAATGEIYLSTDAAGTVAGLAFGHGDLLAWRADLGWRLVAAAPADWAGADLDAVSYSSSLLFADDFETGGSARWSATVP